MIKYRVEIGLVAIIIAAAVYLAHRLRSDGEGIRSTHSISADQSGSIGKPLEP